VKTLPTRNGVVVGSHKVWVQLQTAGSKEDQELQKRLAVQRRDPETAQILRKYGNVNTTPITVDVQNSREVNLPLD
jgi:hypothetical protein